MYGYDLIVRQTSKQRTGKYLYVERRKKLNLKANNIKSLLTYFLILQLKSMEFAFKTQTCFQLRLKSRTVKY